MTFKNNYLCQFILRLSDRLSPEQLYYAEKIFSSYMKEGSRELTLEDFKKVIPCKNVS